MSKHTRTMATLSAATMALTTLALAAPAQADDAAREPAYDIPDVSPRPYQRVGDVEPFADFGNYDRYAPSGGHWCQVEGRTGAEPIAGRSWMLVEDYTNEPESLYKNQAIVTVTGWEGGQRAFFDFGADRLKCTWLDEQRRETWGDKNPQRYWLSTPRQAAEKYFYTAAVRVGDLIISVNAGSMDKATARQMATRMTVAVERNVRATDLARTS